MNTIPSEHAIDRYLKKIEPTASRRQAYEAILAMLASGRRVGRKNGAVVYVSGDYTLIASEDEKVVLTVYPTEHEHDDFIVRPLPSLYAKVEPPRFIALEGIDGSGKTTLAEGLKAAFPDALFVRCNRDSDAGRAARLLMQGGYPEVAVQAAMIADKYVIDRQIREALKDNRLVVADRWISSALAYASELTEWLRYGSQWLARPKLTMYLDVPVITALERLAKRGEQREPYETSERLLRAQALYEGMVQPKSWVRLDATQSAQSVLDQALVALKRAK